MKRPPHIPPPPPCWFVRTFDLPLWIVLTLLFVVCLLLSLT